ncbi:MAG TPA: deoxyribonuclease IV [Chthoniobacteraceae bacterium]|nr:deoxyribonuclease IV [Chthoniobacteraceae bacterium]
MTRRTSSAKPKPPASTDSTPLLGAHMSIAGGAAKAIDRALSIGCNAMQIFVKNNMQWFAKPLPEEEREAFVRHPRRGELRSVFGHTGYMINLGAINPEFHEKSTRALGEELVRADQLELPFLVLHPGAHMGEGEEAGLAKIAASLDAVLAALPEVRTRVALETTAGQGTTLGRTFEEIASLFERSAYPERLCVCLDTAHVFAAGYDLTTEAATLAMWDEFDRIIGLERLAAIHCNDSKAALGSRVDRHDHIGKGKIGLDAFRVIMSDPRFAAIPKVLETPKGKEMAEDVENMAVLRGLMR